jgi:hypothetical protein
MLNVALLYRKKAGMASLLSEGERKAKTASFAAARLFQLKPIADRQTCTDTGPRAFYFHISTLCIDITGFYFDKWNLTDVIKLIT